MIMAENNSSSPITDISTSFTSTRWGAKSTRNSAVTTMATLCTTGCRLTDLLVSCVNPEDCSQRFHSEATQVGYATMNLTWQMMKEKNRMANILTLTTTACLASSIPQVSICMKSLTLLIKTHNHPICQICTESRMKTGTGDVMWSQLSTKVCLPFHLVTRTLQLAHRGCQVHTESVTTQVCTGTSQKTTTNTSSLGTLTVNLQAIVTPSSTGSVLEE